MALNGCVGSLFGVKILIMKRADIYLAAGAVILALILIVAMHPTKNAGSLATVYLNAKEYARLPLYKADTLSIEQENGQVNVIETDGLGHVRMLSSTCKNQLCVHQGWLGVQEADNSGWIVCLPNGVSIQITEDGL